MRARRGDAAAEPEASYAPAPDPGAGGAEARDPAQLLEAHLGLLRAFIRLRAGPLLRAKESVTDLVQSTCRELLEHQERFRHVGDAQFRSWLFATATRKVLDRARFYDAEKRRAGRETALPASALPDADVSCLYQSLFPSPSEVAMGREEAARVEVAFDLLPEEFREVILLARVAGLPHVEIGARLGRTEAAVRTLLSRALARLALALRGPEE